METRRRAERKDRLTGPAYSTMSGGETARTSPHMRCTNSILLGFRDICGAATVAAQKRSLHILGSFGKGPVPTESADARCVCDPVQSRHEHCRTASATAQIGDRPCPSGPGPSVQRPREWREVLTDGSSAHAGQSAARAPCSITVLSHSVC